MIFLIAVLSVCLKMTKEEPLPKRALGNYKNKTLIITRDRSYIRYRDDLEFSVDNNFDINRDINFTTLLKKESYKEALNLLNIVLVEKLNGYVVDEFYKGSKGHYELPIIEIDGKKYIDSFKLNQEMIENYYKIDKDINSSRVVDILNGNGRAGYAGRLGEKLKKEFGFSYTAANNEKREDYTYIINKSLSKEELTRIVEALDEKYIKIKDKNIIITLADVIIVVGKDNKHFTISLETNSKLDIKNYKLLRNRGYRGIKRYKIDEKIEKEVIIYSAEDYFTAYKLSKILKIDNMIEDNNLKNKIKIQIRGGN